MNSEQLFSAHRLSFVVFYHNLSPFAIFAALFVEGISVITVAGVYKNAFSRFGIDAFGIHSKYISVKWEDIDNYCRMDCDFYPVKSNRFVKISCPSVLCFGEYDENKNIHNQDKRKCVFISLIPEHLSLLEIHGKGKSKSVDEILTRYLTQIEK